MVVSCCPQCSSDRHYKDGLRYLDNGSQVQRYLCRNCGYRFSQLDVKVNIAGKVDETFDSGKNRHEVGIASCDGAVEKVSNGASLVFGEDVGSHNASCLSIVEKELNTLPFYNSKFQICVKETKNLESQAEKTVCVGEKDSLIEYAWKEKKRGIADATITHRVLRLNALRKKGVNLSNPDSLLTVLMTEQFSPASKFHYVQAYISYAGAFDIPFKKPKIAYEPKQQYTPKPYEVTTLLQNLGKQQRALCMLLADCGARIGEVSRLQWNEIDVTGQIVYINHPEKGSRSRKIHVSQQTITMLQSLPKKYAPYVFNPNKRALQSTFARSRKRIADKLQMPNLLNIHHHSFRRYFADQTYKKTQFNVRKVQARLGHKRLSSTEKYFGDFDDENCSYETMRVYTIEQAEEARQMCYELFDTMLDENGKTCKLYSRLT